MADDLYEVLGVSRDASDTDIKKAYRALARQYHPDVAGDDPESRERFQAVSVAYEVLRDPTKRSRYDRYGSVEGPQGVPFADFGSGFSDIFEAFFGDRFGSSARPSAQGSDAQMGISVTLEEAAHGVKRSVNVTLATKCETCDGAGAEPGTHARRCDTCDGQGQVHQMRQSLLGQMVTTLPCPTCRGAGEVVDSPCRSCAGEGRRDEERTLEVDVPAGIASGQRLRLAGRGPAGFRGGPPGDLYLSVSVNPDERFSRDGDDLLHELNISMVQAALGTSVKVPSFDGDQELTISAGTQPGTMRILKGLGIPNLRSKRRGDLKVRVNVQVPTKLNADETALLAEFASMRGEAVNQKDPGLFSRLRSSRRDK